MKALIEFVQRHINDDTTRIILEREKYPEIDISLAVNCIESRRKLKGKVKEWYDQTELLFPVKLSAEQCSSSATGEYKAALAEKIAIKSDWCLTDLTGGLGVDSWFFSKKAKNVIYNEMQSILCNAANHNFKILKADNIKIVNAIAAPENIGKIIGNNTDIVYIDPARRGEGGKKVFLIEDCVPDTLTLKDEIFKYTRHILIKLSPMADITMVCHLLGSTCREVHVVSTGGECKELLIWMDRNWDSEYTIHAVELNPPDVPAIFTFNPTEEKQISFSQSCPNAVYLFEPGKSLMKAGPFNLIAQRFNISKIGKSTHYYITDSLQTAQMIKRHGKIYKILEIRPLDKKSIKEIGIRYPKTEVTARNIPMNTDTLRKRLGVTSGDDAHIFGLKSDTEGNLLIVACKEY